MVSNPFFLRAGTVLVLINSQEKEIGEVVLKESMDIVSGFDQDGVRYKTVSCDPVKRIFRVMREN